MNTAAAPILARSRVGTSDGRSIYVSAGERSGDEYLADLVDVLGAASGTRLAGMAGTGARSRGVECVVEAERLTAMGFAEVVRTVPAHLRAFHQTRRWIDAHPPAAAVLVDYPGYHLHVARMLQRRQVPVLQYVAPQLWAWGAGRLDRWKSAVDHCAAILPFEAAYFNSRGLPTTFVGHPLLDRFRNVSRVAARSAGDLPGATPVLAVFPGSRRQERLRMWPVFREAAIRLRDVLPDLEVIVAAPGGALPDEPSFRMWADPEMALAAADVALCKSGTSTLLAALCGTPMVVAYRAHPWSFALARRLVTIPRIALVNVIGEREVVPELLQEDATPEALADAVLPLFRDPAARERQQNGFQEIVPRLGTPGAAARVADLVREMAS